MIVFVRVGWDGPAQFSKSGREDQRPVSYTRDCIQPRHNSLPGETCGKYYLTRTCRVSTSR